MTGLTRNPETLRSLPLFAPLTESQWTWLLPSLRERSVPARTCIVHAGEPAEGLYVLLSGKVRVVHEDTDGHALIAGTLTGNEFFGEMGLIDSTPCPASVHAIERSDVLFVPRQALLEALEANGAATMYMLKVSLERLCQAHHKMANLALMNVHGRVARVLLEHGREANGDWLVEPGSEQIAAMVGASREMVSRVVRGMIRDGIVRRYKRKLIVLDRAALASVSARPQSPHSVAREQSQQNASLTH